MGDLKPIGSEKLTGQDKIKRIMEIARFKETTPAIINETAKTEFSVNLADGINYQIVKERQGYVIKKFISESETDYIEQMKNRKYYSSYSQAFKRMNLLAGELNRLNENDEGVSLYGEQKKFVLKTPKPVESEPEMAPPTSPPMAPPSVPSPELPPPPMEDELPDEGGEESVPMDDTADMNMDMGGEEGSDSEENVTFKTIQKLTGKLTQKIRTLDNAEGMTSEDIKYVINMVLSSLDLNSISEEDKEDIMSKFEEDSEDLGGDDMEGEDMTDDTEVEDIQADMDIPMEGEMEENSYGAIIDHIFSESKVDKVISKYFEISKKEILETRNRKVEKNAKNIVEVKRQMKEVIKFSETIEQELASKKFLEENYKAVVVGKTNKNNLVFENNGKQIKISPEGLLV
jgi:hypothetical protein